MAEHDHKSIATPTMKRLHGAIKETINEKKQDERMMMSERQETAQFLNNTIFFRL